MLVATAAGGFATQIDRIVLGGNDAISPRGRFSRQVALLVLILATGNATTRLAAVGALILAVLSSYWRMYPAIKRMDEAGWLEPRGYSRKLGVMIAGFIGAFTLAVVIHLLWSGNG